MGNYHDPYLSLRKNAEQHNNLYHFTNMESFEKIIMGGALKLNRLDQMDDKGENEYLVEFWKNKVFACCFTHSSKGKARFWEEYAENDGVRIEFPNQLLLPENYQVISENGYCFPKVVRTIPQNKRYDCYEDWGVYDISKVDMYYLHPLERENWQDRGNGLVKNCLADTSYDWEEETRIRIAMRPLGWEEILDKTNEFLPMIPFFKSVYIKLGSDVLRSIGISVRKIEDVQPVRRILSMNPATRNCKIHLLDY